MDNKLKVFLYILGRDYLPLGDIEEIIVKMVEPCTGLDVEFSNTHLANYAQSIAEKLLYRFGPTGILPKNF